MIRVTILSATAAAIGFASVAVCALAQTSTSLGFDADRIDWANRHYADGTATLAAHLIIESWRQTLDFELGRRDAETAGAADAPAACAAMVVLYGDTGISVRGMWQRREDLLANAPRS